MSNLSLFCKTTILGLLKKREPLFGGWRVSDFLGAGVSGCVFKLERDDLGQKFTAALKVIPLTRKIDRDKRTLESLQESIGQDAREITHLYVLGDHQNVVGWKNHEIIHEVDQDQLLALVAVMMEYLPRNLADEIRDARPSWERGIKIIIDCLRGLEHVHDKNIIHRDIKPGNIFLTEDGTAKIGDFGVARKLVESDYAETRVGTPLYIAPEVLKDPLGTGYNYQADIYSLGLVALELLTGKLPFDELCQGNRNCMVSKRLNGEPFIIDPKLPPGVRLAILGALAYLPALRYATASEFRLALEKVLDTQGRETIRPAGASAPTPAAPASAPLPESPPEALHGSPSRSPIRAPQASGPVFPSAQAPSASAPRPAPAPETPPYPPPRENAYRAGQEISESPFSRFWHAPGTIFAIACAAGFLMPRIRDEAILFSPLFMVFYLVLPLYYIVSRPTKGAYIAVFFFLSLCLYNFLLTGLVSGVIDSTNLALFALYLLCFGAAWWMRKQRPKV